MLQGMAKKHIPIQKKNALSRKKNGCKPMQLTLPETNTVPEEKWLEDDPLLLKGSLF